MKRYASWLVGFGAVVAAVELLAAVTVTVSPSTATVAQGATQQFTATVSGSTNTGVTWSLPGGSATGTLTTSGLYTAPATAGTYKVRATSNASTSVFKEATVTVPMKISLSPTSASLATGAQQQFTATVTGSTNKAVTWSATGGTITTAGLYTAPATAGTYTITATTSATPSASTSATVTVVAPGVTVSPTTATVAQGATQTFTATVTGMANTAVTWTCSGGSVTTGGVWTAPATAGTYTVTATSVQDATKKATATVTVPMKVSVTPATVTMDQGATQAFAATVTGSANTAVTWAVTGGSTNGTITTGGVYTAPAKAGTYTVTATTSATPAATASATITVNPVAVSVTPSTVSVGKGATQAFTANVTGTTNKAVTWTASGGTITTAGVWTAPTTTGTYTITAKSSADTTKTGTASATVAALPVITKFGAVSGSSTVSLLKVTAGDSFSLTWAVSSATTITINQGIGIVGASGTQVIGTAPVGQTTSTVYTLTATNAAGTVTQNFTLEVHPKAQIQSFTSSATTLRPGQSVTLTPVFTGSGTLSWNSGLNSQAVTSGTPVQVTPTASTTFQLSTVNDLGVAGDAQSLIVNLAETGSFTFLSTLGYLDSRGLEPLPTPNGKILLGRANQSAFQVFSTATETLDAGTVQLPGNPSASYNTEGFGPFTLDDGRVVFGGPNMETFVLLNPVSLQVERTIKAPWGTGFSAAGTFRLAQLDRFRFFCLGINGETAIYDVRADSFTPTVNIGSGLSYPGVTVLPNGKVLVTGGNLRSGTSPNYTWTPTVQAWLFDPATNHYTALAATMLASRADHSTALLQDGRVLIAGGQTTVAEIFNPTTQTFTSAGNVTVTRHGHKMTLLPDGRVMLNGGKKYSDPSGVLQASDVEFYEPGLNNFAVGTAPVVPSGYTFKAGGLGEFILPLPSGRYLVVAGDRSNSEPGPLYIFDPQTDLQVVPAVTTVYPGDTVNFSVTGAAASNGATWSLLEGATAGTISGSGLYIAGATPGTYHVVCTSTSSPSITFRATVRVVQRPLGSIQSFTADKTTLAAGDSAVLTPVFSGGTGYIAGIGAVTSGVPVTVTPAASTTYVLTVTDANGLATSALLSITVVPSIQNFTASYPAVLPGQGVTLTAWFRGASTATISDGVNVWTVSSSSPITVVPSQTTTYTLTVSSPTGGASRQLTVIVSPVLSISMATSPSPLVMPVGAQASLAAYMSVGTGYDQSVTWTSEAGTLTTAPGDDKSAIFTAPLVEGTYDITVIPAADPSRAVTVTATVQPIVITLEEPFIELAPGATFRFGYAVNNGDVTWSTDGGSIAADGTLTAPTAPGNYTVTATSTIDPGVTARAKVTVRSGDIIVSPTKALVGRNLVYQFKAVSSAAGDLTWSVVENGGGTVDATGLYTAPSTTGTYTVKVTNADGASATARVTVDTSANQNPPADGGGTPPPPPPSPVLNGVQVSPALVSMQAGGNQAFTARVFGSTDNSVTWAVASGPSGGQVDGQGVFTPAAPGTYVVSATSNAKSGFKGTAVVLVGSSASPAPSAPPAAGMQYTTFTALNDGRLLVAGGWDGVQVHGECYLYDPVAGTFTPTGSLNVPRSGHKAALLSDGRVLVSQGYGNLDLIHDPAYQGMGQLPQSEVYDPAAGTWTVLPGTMAGVNYGGRLVALADGRGLIVGGGLVGGASNQSYEGQSTLVSPAGGFTMLDPRIGAWSAGVKLNDGTVLVTGGESNPTMTDPSITDPDYHLKSGSWIFNPASNAFSAGPSMASKRASHTATRLLDGRVLIVGGTSHDETPFGAAGPRKFDTTATAEIYDPATGLFTPTGSMKWPRAGHAATLLPTGQVLVVGGWTAMSYPNGGSTALYDYPSEVELYNPDTQTWRVFDNLGFGIESPGLVVLPDGNTLLTGQAIVTNAPAASQASPTLRRAQGGSGHRMLLAANVVTANPLNVLTDVLQTEPQVKLAALRYDGVEVHIQDKDTAGVPVQVNVKENPATPSKATDFLTLKLRKLAVTADAGYTFKLTFNSSHIKVWRDFGKSQAVVSGVTAFSAHQDTLVYVEGITPSADLNGELVTLQAFNGPKAIGEDRVKVVVAQMMFVLLGDGETCSGALYPYVIKQENTEDKRADGDLYILRGPQACFSVAIGHSPQFAAMAMGADGSYIVYDGHSNMGLGFAFKKGLTGLQGLMNLGEPLLAVDWHWLVKEYSPKFYINDSEYGDDITTPELYDPLSVKETYSGAHRVFKRETYLSQPLSGDPGTHYHLTRGNTKKDDYHYSPYLIVKAGSADMVEKKWSKMFMNGCRSGFYYYNTLNHGTLFYTIQDVLGRNSSLAYLTAIIAGKDNEGILADIRAAENEDNENKNVDDYKVF